jgi:hypothetical protein
MAAAVAPPLCTWLVAACLSAAFGDGEKDKLRRQGHGGLFGSQRRLSARSCGGARFDGNKSLYLVFVGWFFSASWTAFRAVRTASCTTFRAVRTAAS